jgi:hypothetical protein
MNAEQLEELRKHKEQKAIEAHKMFDVAEKIIMMYMCKYFNKSPAELFVDPKPIENDDKPLILNPIHNDKYLQLNLEIVDCDYVSNIPDDIKENEGLNYSLGFIYHSIITVFNEILSSNIKKDCVEDITQQSFNLEMDDNNITMFPVYIYPKRRGQLMLSQIKEDIEIYLETQKDIPSEVRTKANEELAICSEKLDNIHYDIAEADKIEKEVNLRFLKKFRIGINVKELSKDELPID